MTSRRFLVMRHAASESNIAGKVQGILDVPLAPLGREQAREAAEALADAGITHIYASPLARTLETAQIVASTLGLSSEIITHDGLKARNLGEWAGKERAEIKEMWADPEHPFRKDPDFAPPGGESLRAAEVRTFDALDQICTQTDGVPLLVIHLIGTGAIVHRVCQERPTFKNTETWELLPTQRTARALYVPGGALLPGTE